MGREWGHTGHHGPRILRPVVVVGGLGLIRWPVMHDRRRAAAEAGYRTPAVQRSSCPQKSVPDPSAPSPPLPSRPAPARGSRVCTRAYTLFFFLSLLFLFNDDQGWTEARREIRFVNFTSNGCYFAFPEVVFLFSFSILSTNVYTFFYHARIKFSPPIKSERREPFSRGWQAAGRRLKSWFHARLHGSKVIAFKCGTIVAYASGAPTCDQRLKNNRIRRRIRSRLRHLACPTTIVWRPTTNRPSSCDSQSLSLSLSRVFQSLNIASSISWSLVYYVERGSWCPHFPNAGPMDRES